MKKLILTALIFYTFSSNAQDLNKGDRLFGGSLSFSTFNYNTNISNSNGGSNVGVSPSFSWLIKNNVALGVRGGIGYSQDWAKNLAGQKNSNINSYSSLGVFLKKYKLLKEKFGYYLDHDFSVNYNNSRQESGSPAVVLKNNSKGAIYRFSPGVFYMFSNNFLGEANIGGAFASYNRNSGGAKNFNAGLSFLQFFNLGINYRISSKSKS